MKKDFQNLTKLQNIIEYNFNDYALIEQAITHSSYANEHRNQNVKDNERLEFLGDAILDLIVSEYLYNKHPNLPEGDLSKLRASIVCEASLADTAKTLDIGQYILLGKGEEATGGRMRNSILADALEAITGAIFTDSGFEETKKFINKVLLLNIKDVSFEKLYSDYKTLLQEHIQKTSTIPLKYEITKELGPDHNKDFYVTVFHGETPLGQGTGKSKKEAEQNSANVALKKLVEEQKNK